ncbi:MAG: NTP transferase domain-containing protein [Pseudomonadota bacterium]
MQAIILAAGMGVRLGDLTSESPKALVRVAGRELILRVMDFLDNPMITERIVVTGFGAERLESFLKEHRPDAKTSHNPHFRDGSIRSIETALPLACSDLLVMNVDHIYPRRLMMRIAERKNGISAVCDFDRALVADDMKVKLGPDGSLARIHKELADFDGGYIGMTCCDKASLPAYRRSVGTARSSEGDAASVECALAKLEGEGCPVNICDATGIKWLEVDTPDDLANAESTLNANPDYLR